jgi:glycosyltransferase involved in cell wall biosynthesis
MRLCEESGIPYVVTEHMGPFPLPVYRTPTGLPSFIREPLERAQARIAVSPTLAEQVESFGIVKPSFVPNLVDERLYRPEAARPQREFVFFTLCGMETAKGVDDLLEAIALMLPRLPEEQRHQVRFRLGGEGPALERFRRHARRLGLDAWVTWLGLLSREHSRVEYQSCDAFVLTSHRESFGIVFVEATACGKPVIATRCGGPEAIVTPENGLLVEVGDIGQIADALESMVRGERAFDAGAIRIQFLERFSRSAVVSQLEEIYRGALSADTGRADTGRGT